MSEAVKEIKNGSTTVEIGTRFDEDGAVWLGIRLNDYATARNKNELIRRHYGAFLDREETIKLIKVLIKALDRPDDQEEH